MRPWKGLFRDVLDFFASYVYRRQPVHPRSISPELIVHRAAKRRRHIRANKIRAKRKMSRHSRKLQRA